MSILQVEGLTKTYGKGDAEVEALHDVTFSVDKGEFVAIIGASGSGKSTLMHLIGGVESPTAGRVRVDNKDIFTLSESRMAIFRRRNIGLIYQFYNLIPTLTAGRKHHASVSDGRPQARPEKADRNSGFAGSHPTANAICPTSCPADSSSAYPSGVR